MGASRVVLTSLVMLTLFGCASQADVESLRRDNDEMKSRIFTLDRSVNDVRGEIREGIEKSLRGYQKNLESIQKEIATNQKEMASVRKGSADLQATLDSARVDMQVLTGKIDDIRIMAQKPAEDIALLKDDLAKRLSAIEARLSKVEAGLAEQQKKAAETPQTPEAVYQQGLDLMKAGDAAKARETFSRFLDQNPNSKLAANAHYWVGETYYSEKNYDQAILEFQEVIKTYPESEKAPAAMLKQGMAFRAIGDPKSAAYVYRKLIEQYPKSEEARVAKEKLRQR